MFFCSVLCAVFWIERTSKYIWLYDGKGAGNSMMLLMMVVVMATVVIVAMVIRWSCDVMLLIFPSFPNTLLGSVFRYPFNPPPKTICKKGIGVGVGAYCKGLPFCLIFFPGGTKLPALWSNINQLPATCDKVMRAPPPARTEPREYVEAGWLATPFVAFSSCSKISPIGGWHVWGFSKKNLVGRLHYTSNI